MRISKNLWIVFSLFLTASLLFTSCSKDDKEKPDPDPTDPPIEEMTKGTVSATILFTDSEKTLAFKGTSLGGISPSAKGDTVAMLFNEKDGRGRFILFLVPAKKGKLVMGENGFATMGIFQPDSLKQGVENTYLLGWGNFPEDGDIMDAATYDVSSITKDRITGTFSATMVSNSTIVENGELTEGEIKTVEITNGKFDVPLYSEVDIDIE